MSTQKKIIYRERIYIVYLFVMNFCFNILFIYVEEKKKCRCAHTYTHKNTHKIMCLKEYNAASRIYIWMEFSILLLLIMRVFSSLSLSLLFLLLLH